MHAPTGRRWCQERAAASDRWLSELFEAAPTGGAGEMALVAVGGYGRAELCPHSDIDVVLLHDNRGDIDAVAEGMWYPVWDRGIHLGHRVATVRQCLKLAEDDLDTATSLLSARLVAGSAKLGAELATQAREQWHKQAKHWIPVLGDAVEARHAHFGEVAYLLEPDLKEGRGGLRDVHALDWAGAARPMLLAADHEAITAAYEVILGARVELHRISGRSTNVLVLEEQKGVARALGLSGSDALMAAISAAASTIAWTSDDAWRRARRQAARRGPRRPRKAHEGFTGVTVVGDEVILEPGPGVDADATVAVHVAVVAAEHRAAIGRDTLEQLAAAKLAPPDPWPDELRAAFVRLLLAGDAAIRPIESLDQRGIWVRILPEWAAVRSRPQHNAVHRYTVDRHLLEAVAQAAPLAPRVQRPDLLIIGALLHDIGKVSTRDHVSVGVGLARTIATRMGFSLADVETLLALVSLHLLLPEVATRRDLDDPATIDGVAETVGTLERLDLLAALSEADARATSPAAWGRWKEELLALLVDRVAATLRGAHHETERFPTAAHLDMCETPGRRVDIRDGRLTVVDADRPGLFNRVAGVIALHGLAVHSAAAYSSPEGRALAEFVISDPRRSDTPWARVAADVEAALTGRLALTARIAERARTYGRSRPAGSKVAVAAVSFHNDASDAATVIEVHAPDRTGLLYGITAAMADLDLDIRLAKIETLGHQVIDSFYVVDSSGAKIIDTEQLREIERAILHGIGDGLL